MLKTSIRRNMNYPGVVECLQCNKVLVSFHRHDFKSCGCPNGTFVDGGTDYLRVGGVDLGKIQMLRIVKRIKRKEKV